MYSEYQIPEILKTNKQMNYKLNVHDLIKCLTAPLTVVNHRWLNLCTHLLNTVRKVGSPNSLSMSVTLSSFCLLYTSPSPRD